MENAGHENAAGAPLSMMFGGSYPAGGSNSNPPEFKTIDAAKTIDMTFTLEAISVVYVMLLEHPSLAGASNIFSVWVQVQLTTGES